MHEWLDRHIEEQGGEEHAKMIDDACAGDPGEENEPKRPYRFPDEPEWPHWKDW